MIRSITILLALFACASPLLAKDKNKQKDLLPKFIVDGRYVYVTNEAGYDRLSTGTAQDYNAEAMVSDQIQKWGRYQVVFSPQQADFIIGIRVARSSDPGIRPTKRPNGSTVWVPSFGAELGPSEDMLSVYSPSGTHSAPFWRKTQKNGLRPPVALLQAFRKDVEK
jgi:hypothetical protein